MRDLLFKMLKQISPLILLLLFSCNEVFVKDISDQVVLLTAPSNGIVTKITDQNFYWEKIAEADNYHFQIAKPDFNVIEQLLVDSTTSKTSFSYTLSPGNYEWRVKALNNGYETVYSTYILTIDSTSNLSGITPQLISPINGTITAQPSIMLRWNSIEIAENYAIEVTENNDLGTIVLQEQTTADNIVPTLPEGHLKWRVYAQNSEPSISNWSEFWEITIDTTSPSQPILSYPLSSSSPIEDTTITFEFISGIDLLTETIDSLWIYNSPLLLFPIRQVLIENDISYQDSLGTGVYYWKVRTIDQAGNGNSSEIASFEIE